MAEMISAGNHGERVRSDCRVSLELKDTGGLELELRSKVDGIFGIQIRKQATDTLKQLGVEHARVLVEDSGSLPFVLDARIEAAVRKLKPEARLSQLPELIPTNLYESNAERIRFSRLYLPGNSPSMMLNAGLHEPDGVILDLEDSVAPDRKDEARLLVRNALAQVDFYGAERMVRINQLPLGLKDLDAVIPVKPHLVLLPKCEHAAQVKEVDERISAILKEYGQQREVYIMPIIESAIGVEHAYEIASASKSVVAMAIGLEDYTADLGVRRTAEGDESFYARTRMVNACKAAGIQPIDSVFSDVADMEALRENGLRSRTLGFEGMGCIHPRQIAVIREAFLPDEQEVEKAQKIVAAFEEAEARGLGVVALGSKMIDPPVVLRAQRVMEIVEKYQRTN